MEEVKGSGNSEQQTDSTEDFFGQLEAEVNGGIIDELEQSEQVTPEPTMAPEIPQVTQNEQVQGSGNIQDWEKRYKDSSREAQKMASTLNELKPFVPVLEAMKQDSGLVEHVRNYFEGGGSPNASVTEQLGLEEDFVYDQHEAVTQPDSDSAKVFNAYVQNAVQSRVDGAITQEKQRNLANAREFERQKEETAFKSKHKLSDEQFNDFVGQAKSHTLTLEDAYYLVNKDKASSEVAQNTKKEMLGQMKNVRNIPTSVGNANSQQVEQSQDDNIFDALLGSDGDVDNLFG